MANVLFISEQKLKAVTALHENVEPQDILPMVQQAQDIYVQSLMGTTWYNGLKSRIVASTITSDEETFLDDYVATMLANYALYMAIPTLAYKIFNKSVMQPTSEESTPATLEQIKYVSDSVHNTAEFYRQRALEYLKQNQTLFPEYINPDSNDGMVPDKYMDYYGGLVIPKPFGCGYYGEENQD